MDTAEWMGACGRTVTTALSVLGGKNLLEVHHIHSCLCDVHKSHVVH